MPRPVSLIGRPFCVSGGTVIAMRLPAIVCDLRLAAEHGVLDRHRDLLHQVVALALEARVRPHLDDDVEVAARAAADAGRCLRRRCGRGCRPWRRPGSSPRCARLRRPRRRPGSRGRPRRRSAPLPPQVAQGSSRLQLEGARRAVVGLLERDLGRVLDVLAARRAAARPPPPKMPPRMSSKSPPPRRRGRRAAAGR